MTSTGPCLEDLTILETQWKKAQPGNEKWSLEEKLVDSVRYEILVERSGSMLFFVLLFQPLVD